MVLDQSKNMTRSLCRGRRFTAAGITSAVIILATAATTAAVVDFDGSSYARSVLLDANMDFFWNIDKDLESIRIAVHAKGGSGWAGFGVSEMGGMEGADIVFYEVATGNITDAHSLEPGHPVTDECTQDWTLVSAEADEDSLVFVAERALDTGDTQDHVFVDDSAEGAVATRVFTAWGDQDMVSYHAANFAKAQFTLYGGAENSNFDPIFEIVSDPAVSSFELRMSNFTVPGVRTWYQRTCVPASDLPAIDKYHAVGFEAIVNNDTAKYVHHLVLRAYSVDRCGRVCDNDGSKTPSASTKSTTPITSTTCKPNFADIFIWAPGSSEVVLPHDVGFLLGNASGRFMSLQIEAHYNNPDEDLGMIDDSGVRVYYTEELRPTNMGVIQLGDPFVRLRRQPVPEGKSSFSFQCPSSCFEEHFQDDTVTVFSHGLHMHENGQQIETRQYRNNSDGEEVMVYSARVEYYSFLQAGFHMVTSNHSVTIQKGDRFETNCYYDTNLSSVGAENVIFGLSSGDEMCIDYVMYYPEQDIPMAGSCGLNFCGGSVNEPEELAADSNFGRIFGTVDTCTPATGDDEEFTDEPTSYPRSRIPELHAED